MTPHFSFGFRASGKEEPSPGRTPQCHCEGAAGDRGDLAHPVIPVFNKIPSPLMGEGEGGGE
jgi:hypothetical protein